MALQRRRKQCPIKMLLLRGRLYYTLCIYCLAPGDTCVYAMCRGRHRVENRVCMRHVTYFADRNCKVDPYTRKMSRVCVCLCVCVAILFTAVPSKLHVRMESALDDLLTS